MENGPFEDVFPIENGDFPAGYVSLPEGTSHLRTQGTKETFPPFDFQDLSATNGEGDDWRDGIWESQAASKLSHTIPQIEGDVFFQAW